MKKIAKKLSFILLVCLAVLLPANAIAATMPAPPLIPSALQPAAGVLRGTTVVIYTGNLRGDITVLPQVAALRAYYTAKGADVILVDTGNFLQGTIYSAYDSGRSVIELMSQAGYDVVAIGSREFDFGTGTVGVETHGIIFADDSLGYLLDEASFCAVAANIVAADFEAAESTTDTYLTGDALFAFGANTVVTTAAGRSVAFFGLTNPDTVYQVLASNLDGLSFLDPAGVVAYQAQVLAGYDIAIGLSNIGAPQFARGAVVLDVYPGAGLTVGVVIICNDTNALLSHSLVQLCDDRYDTVALAAVDAVRAAASEEFPVFATANVTLEGTAAANRSGETNTGNLWANALRWFALEGGIADFFDEDDIEAGNTGIMVPAQNVVAVWNGGNLRDFINTGAVTRRDLQRVLPFPNRVAVMYLTGAQLLEMLEAATQGLPFTDATFASAAAFPHVAGIEFTVDTTTPFDRGEAYGNHWYRANSINRVTIQSINGNVFNPAATYAIITSNAIFNGMDSNYISLERDEEFSTITSALVVDAVWMYIMRELGGVICQNYAQPAGNIVVR